MSNSRKLGAVGSCAKASAQHVPGNAAIKPHTVTLGSTVDAIPATRARGASTFRLREDEATATLEPSCKGPRSRQHSRLETVASGAVRLFHCFKRPGSHGVWRVLAQGLADARSEQEIMAALRAAALRLAKPVSIELRRGVPVPAVVLGQERPGILDRPLRFAGRTLGILRVRGKVSRRAWARLMRELEPLIAVAAASLHAIEQRKATRTARPSRPALAAGPASIVWPRDQVTGLPCADYLEAVLTQIHSRRAGEPWSLLIVATDHLAEVRASLGREFADAALGIVSRVVRATLRASDPVARLDADSLAVVLPGTARANALRVADALGRAIAEAGLTSSTPRPLTATIGLASIPDDADDAESLRAAAQRDLARKRTALDVESPEPAATTPAACHG